MIVEGDLRQLEWRCAAFLSQDEAMIKEIMAGVDQHQYTLDHFFGGKGLRVHAKIFNFGLIYGRTEWGYFKDADMPSFPVEKWREIIKAFFQKYRGLKEWHDANIKLVNSQGYITNPTGRVLKFPLIEKVDRKWGWQNGKRIKTETKHMGYHEPHIKNYPVQSFATADLVPLAAVQIWRKIKNAKLRAIPMPIIHDSFLYDVHPDDVDGVAEIMTHYVKKLPETVQNYFGFELNVPMDCEVKTGPSWGEMSVKKCEVTQL